MVKYFSSSTKQRLKNFILPHKRPPLKLAFDIETTMFNPFHEPQITLIGFSNGLTEIFFDTKEQAQSFLLSSAHNLVIVAHNLQFDYSMLFDNSFVFPKNLSVVKSSINGEFPHFSHLTKKTFVYRNNRKKRTSAKTFLFFIDTMNFVKRSLEDLMKVYTPEHFKDDSFGLTRNREDILATYKIYFNNFYFPNKRQHPKLSVSSIAFSKLLDMSGYQWENRDAHDRPYRPQWLVKKEQESYRGGIVYPNPRYLYKLIPNGKYFDITSMYPYIMRDLKVPVKYLFKENLTGFDYESCRMYVRDHEKNPNEFRLYSIKAITTQPILITKIEGKNELPIGKVEGFFCENELVEALDKLSDLEIGEVLVYKSIKGAFSSFVKKYFTLKNSAKTEVEVLWAKILLNSSYGRFAMKKREQKVPSEEEKELILSHDATEFNEWVVRQENGCMLLERISEKEAFKSVTIVASAITAGSRALLMRDYDPIKTIYMDTDSQIRTDNDLKLSDKLGGWKIEKEGDVIIYGKKWYKFNKKLKCKGVPKSAKQLDINKFSYYQVVKPRSAIKRKLPVYSLVKVIKTLELKKNQ